MAILDHTLYIVVMQVELKAGCHSHIAEGSAHQCKIASSQHVPDNYL